MLGVLALLVRQLASSRRCLAAWIVYAAVLAIAYSLSAGPPLEADQFTAAMLLPVAVWLTTSAAVLDTSTATLFAAALGGPGRLFAVAAAAGGAAGAPLVVAAVGWSALANPRGDLAATAAAGLLAHAAAWLTGTAAGALTSRPVLGGAARSLLAGVVAAVLLLAFPAASPAGHALLALTARATTGDRLASLLFDLLAAVVLAAVAVPAAAIVVSRTRALSQPPR